MIIEGISIIEDDVFRKVFADEEILRDFILSVLDEKDKEDIVSLKLRDTEIMPNFRGGKASQLYVLAETDKKEKINIEVLAVYEPGPPENFDDRMLAHSLGMHGSQQNGISIEEYCGIHRTITINILDFEHPKFNDDERLHHTFMFMNDDRTLSLDDIAIHYLYLSKIKTLKGGQLDALTKFDKWLFFIKNEGEKEILAILEKEPMIAKAMAIAQIA